MENVIDFATRQKIAWMPSNIPRDRRQALKMTSNKEPVLVFVPHYVFKQITEEQIQVLRSTKDWPGSNMKEHATRLGRPYADFRRDVRFLERAGLIDRNLGYGCNGSILRTNADLICTTCPTCCSPLWHEL